MISQRLNFVNWISTPYVVVSVKRIVPTTIVEPLASVVPISWLLVCTKMTGVSWRGTRLEAVTWVSRVIATAAWIRTVNVKMTR